MSRIGKRVLTIPEKVNVELVDQTLTLLEIDKLNKLAKHIVSSSDMFGSNICS